MKTSLLKEQINQLYKKTKNLEEQNSKLIIALSYQMSWKMRDGSPCCCPAGSTEGDYNETKKMPTHHSTACEMARKALSDSQ